MSSTHTATRPRASLRAAENYRVNTHALGLENVAQIEGEFVFGRDGYLTLRDVAGAWHTGCSLPRRAAETMLKKMPVSGRVACFLGPTHAAQLRVALDQLRFDQAIIALMLDANAFQIALHCEDFTKDIAAHRVFFAAGEDWAEELATIFRKHFGLAPPSHFIRLPILKDADGEAMMRNAQKVFSAVANERAAQIKSIWQDRAATSRETPRACLIAAGAFRLWDDAGHALSMLFKDDAHVVRLDPDDPASTSPLAVARTASKADVVLSCNMFRGDAPAGIVPETIPWITWVTNQRMPAAKSAGARDRLLVLDEAQKGRAIAAGWNAARVDVAGWPVRRLVEPLSREAAVILDLPSLECPESLAEFSSFKLLWDAIRNELIKDPTSLRDPDDYLNALRRRLSIGDEGFPRATFIDELITPAFAIGWVQALVRAKSPARVYGRGWNLPESRGAIETREQLDCAISHASCLLDLSPVLNATHPIHSAARLVIRPFGKSVAQVVELIKNSQSHFSAAASPTRSSTLMSRDLLDRIIDRALSI